MQRAPFALNGVVKEINQIEWNQINRSKMQI